jgi:hypothetical protein
LIFLEFYTAASSRNPFETKNAEDDNEPGVDADSELADLDDADAFDLPASTFIRDT